MSDNEKTRLRLRNPTVFWSRSVFMCPWNDCESLVTTSVKTALEHLKSKHSVIISKLGFTLGCFQEYIESHLSSLQNTTNGTLTDLSHLPRDVEIRQKLGTSLLENALKQQENDRLLLEDDDCKRKCLFCHSEFQIRQLFKHMLHEHSFNCGNPENLVDIDAFLSLCSMQLDSLICLYCEGQFKDHLVLRTHQRKKRHCKISGVAKFDQFFIQNYYENTDDDEDFASADSDDCDLVLESEPTMCLFDSFVFGSALEAHEHMITSHSFNIIQLAKQHELDFYKVIRLINHIRRFTSLLKCYVCNAQCADLNGLNQHLADNQHYQSIPDKNDSLWSNPQYLFPTFENDPLLFDLDFDSDQ